MKTLLFSFAIMICFMVISCGHDSKNGANTASTASASESDIAARMIDNNSRIYQAIMSGRFEGIDTLMAEDMVDHYSPSGREIKGRDSVIANLKNLHNMFDHMNIETISSAYDPENNYVLSLVRVTGTSKVAIEGMPVNTKIDMQSVDVVKLKNGKATDHWEFDDPKEMMKMMSMNNPIPKK